MKLYALSDLHLGHPRNREQLEAIAPRPEDWLILAGDLGESEDHMRLCFDSLAPKFARLFWVPGNHELWTMPSDPPELRGEERYRSMIQLCHDHGIVTPEDPYVTYAGEGGPHILCPLFILYDYSFRPDSVTRESAITWATESGILCADEEYLYPDPFPTREAWCAARCELTERRLAELSREVPLVLINHYPTHRQMVTIPNIPRFTIWCGTRRTEDWHKRFNVAVVVSGHLHVRSTRWMDDVRFEEVSLGYPRQWRAEAGVDFYVREILPGPPRGNDRYHR